MNRIIPKVCACLAAACFLLPRAAGAEMKLKSPTSKKSAEASLGKKGKDIELDTNLIDPRKIEKAAEERKVPTLNYDTFRYTIEVQVDVKREEQIEYIKKLLELNPPEKEKPDLFFRLAELYWEKSKSLFFKANAVDDEISKAGSDKAKVSVLKKQQDELTEQSRTYRSYAVKLYEAIIKQYGEYEKLSDVLFYLAFNLDEMGQKIRAMKVYRTLIEKFPQSPFIGDAWLAFGEYYFSQGISELDKAIQAYTHVLDFPDAKVYGYALYKLGWCYYNQMEWGKSLEKFEEVIRFSTSRAGESRVVALRKEALRDYVLTYSHIGSASKAEAKFREIGSEKDWLKMVQDLGQLYFEQGKFKEAIIIYRRLIETDPSGPMVVYYQGKIVDCASRTENKRYTVKQARLLVDMYKQALERVQSSGTKDPEELKKLEKARNLAEKTIRSLALIYHKEYTKTLQRTTADMANEMYADYLELFPSGEKSYKLRYYRAELLYKIQLWEDAADEYTKVLIENPEKGEFRKESALNALLALENVVKVEGKVEVKSKELEKKVAPLPLTAAEQNFIKACENYKKYVPDGEKILEVNFKEAKIYYDKNHFDKAAPPFAEIALKHSEHPLAEFAANLILDTFNLQKEFKLLNEWARKFYAKPQLTAKPALREKLKQIVEESSFYLVGEAEKTEKDQMKIAKMYEVFLKEFPDSKLNEKALYNIAIAYEKADKLEAALSARRKLIQMFPQSELAKGAMIAIAAAYERIANFRTAARSYEDYVKKYAQEKESKDALINAAIFRESLRDYREAVEDRLLYVKNYEKDRDDKELPKVYFGIGLIYEKMKSPTRALEYYNNYIKKYSAKSADRNIEAYVRMGLIKMEMRKRDEAMKDFARAIDFYRKVPKKEALTTGAEYASRARFMQSEEVFSQFAAVKLKLPEKVLVQLFKDKEKLMKDAIIAYADIVKMQVPEWSLAALYRIGALYKEFVKSLRETPIPPQLTEMQKQAYTEMLEEKALPLEDEAVKRFEQCIGKSHELGVYNEWTLKALGDLSDIRPDAYPKSDEFAASPKESLVNIKFNPVMASLNPQDEEEGAPQPQPQQAPAPGAPAVEEKPKPAAEKAVQPAPAAAPAAKQAPAKPLREEKKSGTEAKAAPAEEDDGLVDMPGSGSGAEKRPPEAEPKRQKEDEVDEEGFP